MDVHWWSGLTKAQCRAALTDVGAREIALDEGTGFVLDADDVEPARGIAFLPGLDPTPMGYKERDWFLGAHQAALFDRNGNVGPTIWQDGRIVGGWAVRPDGTVATRLLEEADEDAVLEASRALEGWLDGVDVTPRFRTPLEKALT